VLRERLRMETNCITKEKKFGLVFEEHLSKLDPSTLQHQGAQAQQGGAAGQATSGPVGGCCPCVTARRPEAHCRNISSGETRVIPVDHLVVVCQFGEPISPALVPVDKVQNRMDDAPGIRCWRHSKWLCLYAATFRIS